MNKICNFFIGFASIALLIPAHSGDVLDKGDFNIAIMVAISFALFLSLGIQFLYKILQWEAYRVKFPAFLLAVTCLSFWWWYYGVWYGVIFLILGILIFRADKNQKSDFAKCRAIIETHGKELAIKRKQLVIPRGYGLQDETGWEKEKAFFLRTIVYEPVGRCTKLESFKQQVSALFDEIVNSIDIKSADMNKGMTPREYEQYVAEVLRENGWDAYANKGVGDQGIDVVAVQNGIKIVIQCKLYSNSVGNAAVQEIIAGREFIKADFAAVVSNIKYTLPAKQLAASSGVLLLHDAELPELYSMIA